MELLGASEIHASCRSTHVTATMSAGASLSLHDNSFVEDKTFYSSQSLTYLIRQLRDFVWIAADFRFTPNICHDSSMILLSEQVLRRSKITSNRNTAEIDTFTLAFLIR
jgi:hypothetical protein